jgi:hypothetical protein
MGKRQFTDGVQEPTAGVDEKTSSEVQGSGRAIFSLVNIVFNLIDDEIQVFDAQKCAGKKVDKVKRVGRMAIGAYNKVSVAQEKLGISLINGIIDALF